jgi:tetratricopeptide (TPR) repeat protein
VKGETTPFTIAVENEPKGFWLDRQARVFGVFFDENRSPKRLLYAQGVQAEYAGNADEAAVLFNRALAAEEPPPEDGGTVSWQVLRWTRRHLDARIEASLCRLLLAQGQDQAAAEALDRARHVIGADDETVTLLQAKLDVRRGDYDKAFRRLRKRAGAEGDLDDAEIYALLAIAARKTGHDEELQRALGKAKKNGVDVSALEQPEG